MFFMGRMGDLGGMGYLADFQIFFVQNEQMADFVVVMVISKKAHRTHIEGRLLELKIGANGQDGVNGQ